jgi:hypothetical protein
MIFGMKVNGLFPLMSRNMEKSIKRFFISKVCLKETFVTQQNIKMCSILMAKGLNKTIGHVNQTTFPLPKLAPLLRKQTKALQSGRGFFVLRGLTPEKYSIEENIIIYTGISSYIGSIRGRQDSKIIDSVKKSNMLNHIKDLSKTSVATSIGAPAYTTDKQVFHTDAGDIVSLFSLNTAAKGGESKLASSWRVYNELARTRPNLIKTLAEDWVFDG